MEIMIATLICMPLVFIAAIARGLIDDVNELKKENGKLRYENILLTTRLNQLKIDMEV